jgi:hypothetical protein
MQAVKTSCCRKLTKELCDVVQDFSLVDFTTLDIQAWQFLSTTWSPYEMLIACSYLDTSFQDKESVGNLVKLIDRTNGYIFAGVESSAVEFSKIAVRPVDWDYYRYPYCC